MDGVSGTVVEESGSLAAFAQSTPPPVAAIASIGDLCSECPPTSPSSLSMPICFLVREQAKSLVAIQELQKRMHQLEGTQSEVITAISEVHSFLSVNGADSGHLPLSQKSSASGLSPGAPTFLDPKGNISISPLRNRLSHSKYGSSVSLSPIVNRNSLWKYGLNKSPAQCDVQIPQQKAEEKLNGVLQAKDSAVDSDKQDSGLDSDCRDQGLESNVPQIEITSSLSKFPVNASTPNNPDELLDLLDEIGHKSEILRQHLSSEEQQSPAPELGAEMTKLHHEHLELHRLLCDIKGERDDLNSKISNLECTTDELSSRNKNLQENFMTLMVEKHKLEAKLHGFHNASGRSNVSSNVQETSNDSSNSVDSNKNLSKSFTHKVDASAVSSVLKETNVLDLRKQVLTFMMENEILRSKLDQVEQWLSTKEMERECFEKVAKEEFRELMSENERLRMGFEEQKLESAALKSKVRMLERVLQSVTLENRELNLQLGESFLLQEALCEQPNRLSTDRFSSSGSSSGTCRRMSLPAHSRYEQDVKISCAKAKFAPNTSSFIDVTIEDPGSSDAELAMVLEPTFNLNHHKSSTPMAMSKKQHLKFSEMTKASTTIKLASNNTQSGIMRKQACKRLSFGSQKQSQGVQVTSFGEFPKNATSDEVVDICDKFTRASDHCEMKPHNIIHEKPNDPKTFPFYSILEKLKSNSDYKLSNRNQESGLPNSAKENVATLSSSLLANGSPRKSPGQKCNSPSKLAQDNPQMQTKDRRSNSGHSKNIHKRIQDILDRITSESEEAVV